MSIVKGSSHFLPCPKFGGMRFAPACVTQDRYSSCRKTCEVLACHIKKFPDLVEKAIKTYSKKREAPLLSMDRAGKGLPKDPDFKCLYRFCKFHGKSSRSLKIHLKRSHRGKNPKGR